MRYAHILKGGYIRPEFVSTFYSSSFDNTYCSYNLGQSFTHKDKYTNSAFAVMLNFGKQYVFDDFFAVDGFAGLGLGLSNRTAVDVGRDIGFSTNSYNFKYTNFFGNNNFGFLTSSDGKIGMAIQVGLKVGILLGKKSEK